MIKITDPNTGKLSDVDTIGVKKYQPKAVRTKATLFVPLSLVTLLCEISRISRLNGMEYAVLYKVEEINKTTYKIIPDDYIIPPQRVTTGHVAFTEGYDESYNGVVHRHPAGVRKFSNNDVMDLNRTFKTSFLYLEHFDMPQCIVNVDLGGFDELLQLNCDLQIVGAVTPDMKFEFDGERFLPKLRDKTIKDTDCIEINKPLQINRPVMARQPYKTMGGGSLVDLEWL